MVIVPKLNVQLLMLRCPKANFDNSLFSILEKVEAIIRTVCGDGKAAGNSFFTVIIVVAAAVVITVITAYSIID
eukprot:8048750-Ditylum_brightwellii.AAC.1